MTEKEAQLWLYNEKGNRVETLTGKKGTVFGIALENNVKGFSWYTLVGYEPPFTSMLTWGQKVKDRCVQLIIYPKVQPKEGAPIGFFKDPAYSLMRLEPSLIVPTDLSKYPHRCTKCGSPSYNGFNVVDCTNPNCR